MTSIYYIVTAVRKDIWNKTKGRIEEQTEAVLTEINYIVLRYRVNCQPLHLDLRLDS